MELSVMVMRLVISPEEDIHLPEHPGSAIRGAFGQGLYNVVCSVREKECENCETRFRCPYSILFNPFLTEKEKEETSKRFWNKPRPFVIEAEKRDGHYKPGEEISFRINLFGLTTKFLPYIIESWRHVSDVGLGSTRGSFELKEVWLENNISGRAERIFSSHEDVVKNVELQINGDDVEQYQDILGGDKIKLRFVSPVLMKYEGSYVNEITFEKFMRNLFRRLSSLSHYYGEERLDINFSDYLDRAKDVEVEEDDTEWEKWYRYSNRQNKRIEMQGLVGEVVFAGELGEYLPYLIRGQYIHVGKNTVFGQGEYEVNEG